MSSSASAGPQPSVAPPTLVTSSRASVLAPSVARTSARKDAAPSQTTRSTAPVSPAASISASESLIFTPAYQRIKVAPDGLREDPSGAFKFGYREMAPDAGAGAGAAEVRDDGTCPVAGYDASAQNLVANVVCGKTGSGLRFRATLGEEPSTSDEGDRRLTVEFIS